MEKRKGEKKKDIDKEKSAIPSKKIVLMVSVFWNSIDTFTQGRTFQIVDGGRRQG